MIASLSGTVESSGQNSIVITIGGIGLLVHTTARTAHDVTIGDTVSLVTYLAVREDALDLYGFTETRDKEMFLLLLTLPGVGPKTALDLLSRATVDIIVEAVGEENPEHLTRMSGIGKKSAEKIVLGLKDKIGTVAASRSSAKQRTDADVVEAIMALGYSANEARVASRAVPPDVTDIGERVKKALKHIGQH